LFQKTKQGSKKRQDHSGKTRRKFTRIEKKNL